MDQRQPTSFSDEPEMAHRPARRDGLGRGDDALRVDAVMTIEILDGAGLAEVLDAKRAGAVTVHRAEPTERRGVGVADRDQRTMRRQPAQQPLDVRLGMSAAALARALRRGPSGVEAVR